MFFNFEVLLQYLDVPNARRYINNLTGVSFDEEEMKIILPIIKKEYKNYRNNLDQLFEILKENTNKSTHSKLDLVKVRLYDIIKYSWGGYYVEKFI